MKKHPFINILRRFFKKLGVSITGINSSQLIIKGGVLQYYCITVLSDGYVWMSSIIRQQGDMIKKDFMLNVNNSVEAFLYKLFKMCIITERDYKNMSAIWQS